MTEANSPTVELDELIALYYPESSKLGIFNARASDACPAEYRAMLAHESHMTVTVEKRHGCEVDVQVLEASRTETHYVRKILLRRKSDQRVVQFGIVRLALGALQPAVRDEIMAQQIPLGRVLINHGVLRHVQLHGLWHVDFAEELAEMFEVTMPHAAYGRTALIFCDGEPAVELLEIVAPEDTF